MGIGRYAGRALVAAGLLISPATSSAQPMELLARGDVFEEQAERESARRDREESLYDTGQRLLEKAQWQQAAERFSSLASLKGSRVDAALFWKAYALDKLGQKAEALATASELIKGYPTSRWMNDAKALEIQVRQSVGQPVRPEAEADEELKLLAIQGLQHSDPEQAIPMLEKILQGSQSPRLKERALFVLAQSNSPRARQAITAIAKGAGIPTSSAGRFSISARTEHARTANCSPRSTAPRAMSTSSVAFCAHSWSPAIAPACLPPPPPKARRSFAPKPSASLA